jgi:cell cycle protein, ftsW/rodA/spoVE family
MEYPAVNANNTQFRKGDKYIWGVYIFLIIVSVIELYSASSREVTASNVLAPIMRHGFMLLLGFGVVVGLSRVKYKVFNHGITVFALAALLIAVYVLFKGQIINGARRSMSLFGIALQSAELLKIAVVLVIARVIAFNQERGGVTTFGVARCAFFVLLCSGLLFTQGLTNTLLLMGISISMMLIGGIQNRKLGIVLLIYLIIGGAGYMWKSHDKQSAAEVALIAETGKDASGEAATFNRTGTHKGRIARWLFDSIPKYEQPITSVNRQEMYSFMAQANGGWHGVLPGNSRETARLPLAFSDYIFAIVIEDWGFMGGMLLLTAYLILLGRAGAIAAKCRSAFPSLLIMGMAVMIVLQALFHMAIVTGVFPVSGQPLPLISKGGSSILVTSIAFGIMLSVSRSAAFKDDDNAIISQEIADLPADLNAPNPMIQ